MAITAPVNVKSLPELNTFETGSLGPLDLKNYIQSAVGSGTIRFSALLADGKPLPQGVICTEDGLVTGIPAKGTAGFYSVVIFAQNDSEEPAQFDLGLSVRTKPGLDDPNFLTHLKSQVWQALGSNAPLPEMEEFWNRPITAIEIYYLFQRFGVLTVWDVFNLETPGDKVLLNLEENSPHYNIYDRGSCLVAAPKDLYSHARTLEDALQASRVLAREVYKRGWTIEFAGFNKMVRAAWVELQHLGDKYGKKLEILHFEPSINDLKIYETTTKPETPTPP